MPITAYSAVIDSPAAPSRASLAKIIGERMRFVALVAIIAFLAALGLQLSLIAAEPMAFIELMLSQSRAQQTVWIVMVLVPVVFTFVGIEARAAATRTPDKAVNGTSLTSNTLLIRIC